MRRTLPIVAALCATAFAAACTSTERTPASDPKPSAGVPVQREQVEQKTKEAALAVRDYARAQQAELVRKSNERLLQIQQELDRLAAKVDRSRAAAKAEAEGKLRAVREQWDRAKKELDQAASASASTWDRVKVGLVEANDKLDESFRETRQWVSDKIEP